MRKSLFPWVQIAPDQTVSFKVNLRLLAFFAIFVLTAVNGLYDSLVVEYGGTHGTFLFLPDDLHGDLLKTTFSFPPYDPIPGIGPGNLRYNTFAHHGEYQGVDGVNHNHLTDLHVPPFVLLIFLGLKRLVLLTGPFLLEILFYLVAFACATSLALSYGKGVAEVTGLFLGILFTYPSLVILTRGSFGALLTSMALIGVVASVVTGKRPIWAALLFALALNFRPNVIMLAPLFLVFGWREFFRCMMVAGAVAALLLLVSYVLCVRLYPGYDYQIAAKALNIYFICYVVQGIGLPYNNSLYGVILYMVRALGLPLPIQLEIQFTALAIIPALIIGGICYAVYLYILKKMNAFEYAFALAVLCILGTTVCGTYHLFFLVAFLLLQTAPSLRWDKLHLWLIGLSVLLLAPKNYFYLNDPDIPDISFEVVVSPLILVTALYLIFATCRQREPQTA